MPYPVRRATRRDQQRLARLVSLVQSLPEATAAPYGLGHTRFSVRRKTFAYHLFHHHGDGRVALCAKAAAGQLQALVSAFPERFYVPAYLGPSGWVALRLDLPIVDWDEVLERLVEAYRLQAPRKLADEMT